MRKPLFAFIAAALAVPAFAAPDTASQADQQQSQKPKKEKKICKKMPAPTGSWMSPMVCKTAAEWREEPNDDAQKIGYQHGP
ncbi:MAG TPA: hypothetical protein VH331_02670 [Allosphingosinicella sp.]|nr:hypothetical protein [Allosphingosinicella sp.]